jgi:hypothetical protein
LIFSRGREDDFQTTGQVTTGEQDTTPTGGTFETNVSAQADHIPFISSTWVRFA